MSLSRSIAKNTVIQVAGKFIGTILGIMTVAVMTRELGTDGYGQFTTIVSFLQFFGILVDFGLSLTMITLLSAADADENSIVSNIFTMRLVSGVAFFGLAAALGFAFPYPIAVKIGIAVASIASLGTALTQVLVGVFQKHLTVHKAAIAEVSSRTLLFAGVALVAWLNAGMLAMVLVLTACNSIQFLLNLLFAGRHVRFRLAFDQLMWRKIVSASWPIGVSIALNLIYLKGDIIILSLVRSEAEVGLYGAAYKVLDVVTVVPMVFMGVVLPVIASSWAAGNGEDFSRRLGRAFDALSLFAIPLAIGTFPVAADLMRLVAGHEFGPAGRYLSVLMLAGSSVCWGALFGHAIVALGLQRKAIWIYGVDAAISLVLYLILIPKFGAIGAAWVTFFSEAFIVAATAFMVTRATKTRPSFGIAGRALFAGIGMLGVLLAASQLHVAARIPLGIATYVGLLLLVGGLPQDIIALVKKPVASQPAP